MSVSGFREIRLLFIPGINKLLTNIISYEEKCLFIRGNAVGIIVFLGLFG